MIPVITFGGIVEVAALAFFAGVVSTIAIYVAVKKKYGNK